MNGDNGRLLADIGFSSVKVTKKVLFSFVRRKKSSRMLLPFGSCSNENDRIEQG